MTNTATLEDIDAERAVLGAIFIDEARISFLLNSKRFTADMFSSPRHQLIFNTILAMQSKRLPVDVMTVEKRLSDKGNLEKAGGRGCCTCLLDAIPTETHAEFYIDSVIEKYRLRKLRSCVADIDHFIGSGMSSADITSKVMSDIIAQVDMPTGTDPAMLKEQSISEAEETRRSGKLPGIPSFLGPLNEIIGGYVPTNVYVVAARPSDGKTTFVCNELVHKSVTLGVPCALVSMEMSHKLIRDLMAGALADINAYSFRIGKYSDSQLQKVRDAYDTLLNAPLYINDDRMTIEQTMSWLAYTIQRRKIKMVAIDYVQLIKPSRFSGHMSRNDQIMEWSAAIKDMTKRTGVVTLLISQLSRAGVRLAETTPPPPTLEALRESGSLEQDADGVMFIYKKPGESYANFSGGTAWTCEVDVSKNRTGPIGTLKAMFVRNRQKFESEEDYAIRKEQETNPKLFGLDA